MKSELDASDCTWITHQLMKVSFEIQFFGGIFLTFA
jgi:hypothetical protein